MKSQELIDLPPVGLDRVGSQPADLAGTFVLIEELHAFQGAAQELPGQFAQANSTHLDSYQEIDSQMPSDTLNPFRSHKQSSVTR